MQYGIEDSNQRSEILSFVLLAILFDISINEMKIVQTALSDFLF